MDIKDWGSWVKEMVDMFLRDMLLNSLIFIFGIYGLFNNNPLPKFISWSFLIFSGFCFMFVIPYKMVKKDRDELKKCREDISELRNKLNELQPLVNIEKRKQIILPFKKKLENIVDTLSNYVILNQGNDYSFKKFMDSIKFESKLLKDCLKFNSNLLIKLCSYYRARFEESFNLSILMNELNEFGLIIQEIFGYLKDNENNIKGFDKQQYIFFIKIYTSVSDGYLALLNEIPEEIKNKINIISFISLPKIGDT